MASTSTVPWGAPPGSAGGTLDAPQTIFIVTGLAAQMPDADLSLTFTITQPTDALPGTYQGTIVFTSIPAQTPGEGG